jgi:hypothetical protein
MSNHTAQTPGFVSFVTDDGQNHRYLRLIVIACVVQFVVFKILYPFPDFFSDSYRFISAAAAGDNFNTWPIGYSKFLSAVRIVTSSSLAVVAIQYLVMIACSEAFFFTILYFYNPMRQVAWILFAFLFLNPAVLYLCNYISSDPLFSGLSLLWFTQLLWILHQPQRWHIVSHTLLLFVIFTLRYHALYYPVVALVAFGFSALTVRQKIVGIVLPAIVLSLFVLYTRREAYKLTGYYQFSVLSGWHWAANALFMYPHIKVDSTLVPDECRELHRMTEHYFQNVPEEKNQNVTPRRGGFYFRHEETPLKQYLAKYRKSHPENDEGVRGWGGVAPVLSKYGVHLVKEHPAAYAQYYLLPNTLNYFLPPLEKMNEYNMGDHRYWPGGTSWFELRSDKARAVSYTLQGKVLYFFPMLFMMINAAFAAVAVWYVWARLYRHDGQQRVARALVLATVFFLTSLAFNVIAAPIAFRYLYVNMFVLLAFTLLIGDLVMRDDEEFQTSSAAKPNVKEPELVS